MTPMLNLVVWNKSNAGQGRSTVRSMSSSASSGLAAIHTETMSNWVVSAAIAPTSDLRGVNTFGRGRDEALAAHPTVKPVALSPMRSRLYGAATWCRPVYGFKHDHSGGRKVGARFCIEYELPILADIAIKRGRNRPSLKRRCRRWTKFRGNLRRSLQPERRARPVAGQLHPKSTTDHGAAVAPSAERAPGADCY